MTSKLTRYKNRSTKWGLPFVFQENVCRVKICETITNCTHATGCHNVLCKEG